MNNHRFWATVCAVALAVPLAVEAAPPEQPLLVAKTQAGQTIDLKALRGQVVMVVVWSTRCPVCLNKMPELRANLAGWANRGFQIVSINTDLAPDDIRNWEAARDATLPANQRWPSVWAHAPGFTTSFPLAPSPAAAQGTPKTAPALSQLPAIYVVDREGNLRFQATGRMPADVWDTIAELL